MEHKTWTDEELVYLIENAANSTLKELSAHLERPVKMVRWKTSKMNLAVKDGRLGNVGRTAWVWTEERLNYLRENAATQSAQEIGNYLGVPVASVRTALYEHQIQGRGVQRYHSLEEVERRIAPLRGREIVDREGLRICPRCEKYKPVHQYPSETTIESALCEQCRKEVRHEVWANTPELRRRQLYLMFRTNRHGITIERYMEMLEEQDYSCKVCNTEFTEAKRPQIDHNHAHCPGASGCAECVRGILCQRCNTAVGWAETFNASPDFLEEIAKYLTRV